MYIFHVNMRQIVRYVYAYLTDNFHIFTNSVAIYMTIL